MVAVIEANCRLANFTLYEDDLDPQTRELFNRIRDRAINLSEQTDVFKMAMDDTPPYSHLDTDGNLSSLWSHSVNDPVWEFDLWREETKQDYGLYSHADRDGSLSRYSRFMDPIRWYWKAIGDCYHWITNPYGPVSTAIQHERGNFIPNTGGHTERITIRGEIFDIETPKEKIMITDEKMEILHR